MSEKLGKNTKKERASVRVERSYEPKTPEFWNSFSVIWQKDNWKFRKFFFQFSALLNFFYRWMPLLFHMCLLFVLIYWWLNLNGKSNVGRISFYLQCSITLKNSIKKIFFKLRGFPIMHKIYYSVLHISCRGWKLTNNWSLRWFHKKSFFRVSSKAVSNMYFLGVFFQYFRKSNECLFSAWFFFIQTLVDRSPYLVCYAQTGMRSAKLLVLYCDAEILTGNNYA